MLAKIKDAVRSRKPGGSYEVDAVQTLKSSIRGWLREFDEVIRREPQSALHAILSIEAILLSDMPIGVESEDILIDRDMHDVVAHCQRIFSDFELVLERSFAQAFQRRNYGREALADRENVTHSYLVRYRELARREIALGEIGFGDRIAFVGAGSFPVSAIEYALSTDCTIQGLDVDSSAVGTASAVVKALQLDNQITLHNIGGQAFDYESFDVIVVGVLAKPKRAIMQRIAATASKNARILCRTTHGLRRLIYQPTSPDDLRPYQPAGVSLARGYQTLSTWRLERS